MTRLHTMLAQCAGALSFRSAHGHLASVGGLAIEDAAMLRLDDALVARKVLAERVRVLAERSFSGALTAPLGIVLLAWAGGALAGWVRAAVWFAVFALAEFQLARLGWHYRAVQAPDAPIARQEKQLVLLSGLIGLMWGSSVWVFGIDGRFDVYLFNLVVLVAVAAISVVLMSPSRAAALVFFGGLLVSPLVHVVLAGGAFALPMAVALVAFFALLLQYSRVAGQQLIRDLESTVRNGILAERLGLALGAARQDWFELNLQTGTLVASAEHVRQPGLEKTASHSSLQHWLAAVHPDDRDKVQALVQNAAQSDETAELEYRIRSDNDAWLWVRSVGRVVERGVQGEPLRAIGIHTDVSERKAVDAQIRKLAFYDPLTDLPNRRLLHDRLRRAVAVSRPERQGVVMLLDMDDFKALNDTSGHDVGDQFLVEVAQRLQACVGTHDTVARLGGDEFVVILDPLADRETTRLHAMQVAEKLLHSIRQPYALERFHAGGVGQPYLYHCTSSIGVELFAGPSNTVDELMKRADTAMYQAKAMGRNTFRFYDPAMQTEVAARAVLDNDLHNAVRENEFILHFQPQVNGAGQVTGAEVLTRWQHPTRGLVFPVDFIAKAEATGVIQHIGRWVLESACSQLATWATQPETRQLSLSVNISAVQFHGHDFVDHILGTLSATGANPNRLKLEVTESLLLNNVEDIVKKMAVLKANGLGFSLDDFGTGYSSLSYLKILPLEQLKIDKSFVRDVLTDANDVAIIRIVVAVANSMGIAVMAEGVEQDAQRALLAENGCHAYQGYFYGHPVPVEEFEHIARQVH